MDNFEGFTESGINEYLEECHSCGRKFNFDALERHEKICSNTKKRKPFDAKKQRLEGIGVESVPKRPEPKKVPRKANWRSKHEEFISTIRSARGVTAAIKSGNPLPPPPPAAVNPDYVQCPHCNRNFNEHAAERHMPFCKEQKARLAHSNLGPSAAREKQNKRIQYRPPLPGRRDTGGHETTPVKSKNTTSADVNGRRAIENSQTNRVLGKTTSAPAKASSRTALSGHKVNPIGRSPQANSAAQGVLADKTKYRVSSGSSTSDSEYPSKKGSRKEPQWYEDMIKSKTHPSPQQQQQQRYEPRQSKREPDRLSDSGIIDDDTSYGGERRAHSGRRRIENVLIGDGTFSPDGRHAAAIGVVRPSSRHSPSAPINFQQEERRLSSGRTKLARFCHECGTKYPVESAKFCCECGMKRVHIDH